MYMYLPIDIVALTPDIASCSNPWRACTARVTVVALCVCLSVCLSVSPHAILAVRAITRKTKDTIVLSIKFEAIMKRHFS